MIEEECGIHCGKVQTIIVRLPGNKSNTPAGWMVQAKLSIYLWLGIIQNRQFCYSGLPKGFDLSPEIRNAERPGALAPSNIHYVEKHVSQKLKCEAKEIWFDQRKLPENILLNSHYI